MLIMIWVLPLMFLSFSPAIQLEPRIHDSLGASQRNSEEFKRASRLPLLRVTMDVSGSGVSSLPTGDDLAQHISNIFSNMLSSSNVFPRWKQDTCRECPASTLQGDDNKSLTYSFYNVDLRQQSDLHKVSAPFLSLLRRVFFPLL